MEDPRCGYYRALEEKVPAVTLLANTKEHLKNQPPKRLATAGAAGLLTGLAVAACIVFFAKPEKIQ